jgi:hypothetical protein
MAFLSILRHAIKGSGPSEGFMTYYLYLCYKGGCCCCYRLIACYFLRFIEIYLFTEHYSILFLML